MYVPTGRGTCTYPSENKKPRIGRNCPFYDGFRPRSETDQFRANGERPREEGNEKGEEQVGVTLDEINTETTKKLSLGFVVSE